MSYITFNGIRSDELGLRLLSHREINTTTRDYSLIEIAGHDGAFTQDNHRLAVVEQEFQFALFDDVVPNVSKLSYWLNQSVGFKPFEMAWDSKYQYYAQPKGSIGIQEILKRYGKCKINFVFQPVKHRKDSLTKEILINKTMTFINDGHVESYPKLTFTGANEVKFKINGRELALKNIQGNVTVDADRHMVYRTEAVTKISAWDNVLLTSERPYLDIGENKLEISAGQAVMVAKIGEML